MDQRTLAALKTIDGKAKRLIEKKRIRQFISENRDKVFAAAHTVNFSIFMIRHYAFKTRLKIALSILFRPLKPRKKPEPEKNPAAESWAS